MRQLPFLEFLMFFLVAAVSCKNRDATPNGILKSEVSQQDSAAVQLRDQGWDFKKRMWYYSTSQGSQVFPYVWFLSLEQTDSEALFRADDNQVKFGFIPNNTQTYSGISDSDRNTLLQYNPDELPVGLVQDKGTDGSNHIGFTCSLCHTEELHYNGQRLRIDGGISRFDLLKFVEALKNALAANIVSRKFDRFSDRVWKNRETAGRYADRNALNLSGASDPNHQLI